MLFDGDNSVTLRSCDLYHREKKISIASLIGKAGGQFKVFTGCVSVQLPVATSILIGNGILITGMV